MKVGLSFLALVFFIGIVVSQWFQYQLVLSPQSYFYQRGSFFTPTDAPYGFKGSSFFAFDFQFSDLMPLPPANSSYTAGFEMIFTHWSLLNDIGLVTADGTTYVCCTLSLVTQGLCQNLGQTIITVSTDPAQNGNLLWYFNGTLPMEIAARINITVSGPYYLLILNCEDPNAIPAGQSPVQIGVGGLSEWKNPYGFLPAENYPFLSLYWIFFILYTVLAIVMGILGLVFRRGLTGIQIGIGIMLGLALLENLLWGVNYLLFNRSGQVSDAFDVVSVLFSTAKLTMFRLLLLLICLGYSITKAQLTRNVKLLIMLLTAVYFFITLIDLYIDVVQTMGGNVSDAFQFFIVFLVTVVNLVFFGWIFVALFITMRGLKLANETTKYRMYRHLGMTLIGCAIALAVVYIFEFIVDAAGLEDPWWRFWWFFGTYWELVYLAVITVICFIWRPTANNRRFSYVPLNDERMEMGGTSPPPEVPPSRISSDPSPAKVSDEGNAQPAPSGQMQMSQSQDKDIRSRSESVSQSQGTPTGPNRDDSSSSSEDKDIRD